MIGAERREDIALRLFFSGDAWPRLRRSADAAGFKLSDEPRPGDNVRLDWDFSMDYYNCVQQLEALIRLMDDPDVKTVVTIELRKQRILIEDFIDAMRRLQARWEQERPRLPETLVDYTELA